MMRMDRQSKQIEQLYTSNQSQKALEFIEKLIQKDPENDELHFCQGKIYYQKQEWGRAINAFQKALEINPDHPEARSQIDMAKSILGYFTPDMFNP